MLSAFDRNGRIHCSHEKDRSAGFSRRGSPARRGVFACSCASLLVLGMTVPATAVILLPLETNDGATFSGVTRVTKTGAIELFDEQPFGPFTVSGNQTQFILSWDRGDADDFVDCDPTLAVHSRNDTITNSRIVHYTADTSATPGNVMDAQVVIVDVENAGVGTTAPFPLSELAVELTITLPDGSTTTVSMSPETAPGGAAAAYFGSFPTPFPLDGSAQVDVSFSGQVEPPLGPPQTFLLDCPPPNDNLIGTQAFGTTQLILQNVSTTLSIQEPSPTDSDGDGVPDDADGCSDSDLSATVVIDDCDSGVENFLFSDGCTLSDLVQDALAAGGPALQDLLADLEGDGTLSPEEVDAIAECADGGGEIGDGTEVIIDVSPPNLGRDNVQVSAEFVKIAILSAPGFEPAKDLDRRNVKQLRLSDERTPDKQISVAGLDKEVSEEEVNGDGVLDLVVCFRLADAVRTKVLIPKDVKQGGKKIKKTKKVRFEGFLKVGTRVCGVDRIQFKGK